MRNSILVTHGSLRVKESLRKVLPKKSFAPESDDNVIKIYTGINLKAPWYNLQQSTLDKKKPSLGV